MAEEFAIPSAFVDAVRRRVAVLAPGWDVSVETTGWPDLPIRVLLGHRLSNGHQVLFNGGQAHAMDLEPLEAHVRFAADEFAQIARAPSSANVNLLRGIRSLKDAFEWPRDQVVALGGVLSENAALTTEEYAWLREDW